MATKCQMWRNNDGTYHNNRKPCRKPATRAARMPDGNVYQWCESHYRMATFSWRTGLGGELQDVVIH